VVCLDWAIWLFVFLLPFFWDLLIAWNCFIFKQFMCFIRKFYFLCQTNFLVPMLTFTESFDLRHYHKSIVKIKSLEV
jgi:hypothetical protein